jgi:hypothetical protein
MQATNTTVFVYTQSLVHYDSRKRSRGYIISRLRRKFLPLCTFLARQYSRRDLSDGLTAYGFLHML